MAVVLAGIVTVGVSNQVQAQALPIWTESGAVRGTAPDANGVAAFKGIPYAAPPVGGLRWRPPHAPVGWAGVRAATAFGDVCWAAPPPGPPRPSNPPESEDCLSLNVWTPARHAGAGKPVMVWIHGGGFEFGSSARSTYDGARLASEDVVVVTLNYRLGVFGFLAHPVLDAGSGAWGLEDQLAALRWVKRNIAQFGGDPHRVTLFGESAGAHAVGLLLSSPETRGLVDGAIVESGAFWDSEHGSILTHQEALDEGEALVRKLGVADLRAVPADQLNAATAYDYFSDPALTAFAPSIDGQVLRDSPARVFARGEQLDVPILGGWNAVEYGPFTTRALPATTPQVFKAAEAQLFGKNCSALYNELYPADTAAEAQASSLTQIGDLVIAEQTWELLGLARRHDHANTYAYQFSYTSPYNPVADHTTEVPFVFGNLDPTASPTSADRRISDIMVEYWTNFAKRGDPNGEGLPRWPTYQGYRSAVMHIGNHVAAGTETGTDRFAFIKSFRKRGRLPATWRTLGAGFGGEPNPGECGVTDE